MSSIYDLLAQIKNAVYGKDVRDAIHDSIEQCYDDATGTPESIAGAVADIQSYKEQTDALISNYESQFNTMMSDYEDRIDAQVDNLVANVKPNTVVNLWRGISGTEPSGTIDDVYTLSDDISNYDYIDIYAQSSYDTPVRVRVDKSLGRTLAKVVNVQSSGYPHEDNTFYLLNETHIYFADNGNEGVVTYTLQVTTRNGEQTTYEYNDPDTAPLFIQRIDGVKVGADASAEVADIRVGEDGTVYQTAGAAVRGQIADVKQDLSDISITGINLFNRNKASENTALDANGAEYSRSGFYCSEFIEVNPSSDYAIAVGIGSSSFYTCVFYDSSKAFISGSYNTGTSAYTVTTPSTCKYIKLQGALVRIDNQLVMPSMSGIDSTPTYQKIIDGKNENGVRLLSLNDICYDKSTGYLKSASAIYLMTPDTLFALGTSLNVGTAGGYLYWNKKTGSIYTSTTRTQTSEVYLLGFLSGLYDFEPKKSFCMVDSAYPIFNIDLYNNTLTVNVRGVSAYISYRGQLYTLSTGYTQTLTLTNHCVVLFNPVNSTFEVVESFNAYTLEHGIIVLFRYYRNIITNAQYETAITDVLYKKIICYGDSLTWYDGQAFTWGDDEGVTCVGFETYINNELNGRQITNLGDSGKTTPEICTNIKSHSELDYYEVMTIMGGDNDDRLSVSVGEVMPIGSTYDTTTICGALQSAIEYALTQNPSLRIVLMTEPMGWTYRNNTMVRVSDAIPQAYRDVAEFYGLPLIDLWNESGINELTRDTYYADPPDNHYYMYHPNNEGWIRLSKIIVNALKNII